MHELKFLPILFPKVEVGVTLTLEFWNFITLIRKLGKMIYRLYE